MVPGLLVILPLRGRRIREFDRAQFDRVGKFVDGLDAEVLEEKVGGGVEEGATGKFGPALDLDEFAIEEFLQDAVSGDSADMLDGGFGHRLTVGDDGEGFHGRRAQAARLQAGEELANETGVFRTGKNLPAFGAFQDEEGALSALVAHIEIGNGGNDGFLVDGGELLQIVAELTSFAVIALFLGPPVFDFRQPGTDQPGQFGGRERFFRGDEEGFDNRGEIHRKAERVG